jgi:glyoxylate reductase
MVKGEKMKVFITKKIPQEGIELLKNNNIEVEVRDKKTIISDKEMIFALQNFDGIISMLSDNLSADILKHTTKTKIIANYAVGYNNIDVDFARKMNITVTNTPNVLTNATAELACALTLATGRRIVEADKYLRKGKFKGWGPLLMVGEGLDSKTVGIIGMGRIGQAYAKMISGFNAKIIYFSRSEKQVEYERVSFDTLIEKSDVISLHLPLLKETRHLITKKEFLKMKKGVVFVNTARGPIVKEEDLVFALKQGIVSCAGLDVFEFEPEVTKELKEMDNVVLLPHIGSATKKARGDMARLAADNILNVLRGNPAVTEV